MIYDFGISDEEKEEKGKKKHSGIKKDIAKTPKEEKTGQSGETPGLIRTVIYGDDIHKTGIPEHTAKAASEPKIIFEDPEKRRFGMSEKVLSKHLMCLGGIGSGKTNGINFIVETLLHNLTEEDILFIFDTKGDFYTRFYEKDNPNHIVIGNGEQYEDETLYWDLYGEILLPLTEKDGEAKPHRVEKTLADGRKGRYFDKRRMKYDRSRCDLVVKEIAMQLFKGRESETQPFFSMAAADLVGKVISSMLRSGREEKLDNESLVEVLKGADLDYYYKVTKKYPDFESAQLYFGDPKQALTAQALGVFGYINSMVNDLFVGIFGERSGRGPFSMRKLVREKGKKVVFIEYDLSVGEVLSPMYRLLIDLALKEALGRRRDHTGSVYFIIDEFKLLPDLMHIDDALNFGRSLGVKIVAGIQSINQLYDIYGEERGKVLAAGFMNSFCFQTWDYESRKYITERFGDNYTDLSGTIQSRSIATQREGHTVEDWDVLNLDIGEAYINLVGEKPFRFRFSNFDDPHPVLVSEGPDVTPSISSERERNTAPEREQKRERINHGKLWLD